jgi:hypothetical protein
MPDLGQSGDWYEYRIVLEQPNGETLPLRPQGADLARAKERLQEILDDPDTTYPKGWIERRDPNAWQTFTAAQTPRRF